MNNKEAEDLVLYELRSAQTAFPVFHGPHEGYAVILEEMDELWDEIRRKPNDRLSIRLREEAAQVAAMALRFMIDLT